MAQLQTSEISVKARQNFEKLPQIGKTKEDFIESVIAEQISRFKNPPEEKKEEIASKVRRNVRILEELLNPGEFPFSKTNEQIAAHENISEVGARKAALSIAAALAEYVSKNGNRG